MSPYTSAPIVWLARVCKSSWRNWRVRTRDRWDKIGTWVPYIAPRAPRDAERLHLAVGRVDMLLFRDFQKLISCLTI